jgi:hypothetical protein
MKQDEENFHRIIREKLQEFQPDISPNDWQQMRRKLLISNILRFVIPSITIAIIGLSYYFVKDKEAIVYSTQAIVDALPSVPLINEIPKIETKKTPDKIIETKESEKNTPTQVQELATSNPVFPELFNETTNLNEVNETEIKVSKIASRKMPAPETHNDLAEKEIRYMASTAVSMSDKISRVRQLGKTFELTSYQALDRNIEKWKNIVLVCDITTSMFPYTTQVFDWLNENKENTTIKGIVFFTDCDSLGRQTRGRLPGKMFSVRNRDELLLWDTMFAAINNTENNKDKPENNIEALLYAQKNFPDADEFVMIADNSSEVKDMRSLSKMKKKVHVILCGETFQKNYAFQSDYVEIAKKTKGSIHTLEDDVENVAKVKDMSIVRVGNVYFRFHKGKFYTTKFLTRP